MTLEELYEIIEDRKKNMPKDSYVASLFKDGLDRIIQKVGEETVEVVIAAKTENRKRVISEISDLLFHILVLLSSFNIDPKLILKELAKRNKKNSRIKIKKAV